MYVGIAIHMILGLAISDCQPWDLRVCEGRFVCYYQDVSKYAASQRGSRGVHKSLWFE